MALRFLYLRFLCPQLCRVAAVEPQGVYLASAARRYLSLAVGAALRVLAGGIVAAMTAAVENCS